MPPPAYDAAARSGSASVGRSPAAAATAAATGRRRSAAGRAAAVVRLGRTGPTFSREKLVRPTQGRYIAGVCGALGRATNTDPVLWRVLLAVLGFFGGVGVLIYLIGWLAIPGEGDTASPIESLLGRGRSGMKPLSIVLLGGAAVLTFAFVVNDGFRAALLAVAVLIGAALLLKRNSGNSAPSGAGPGRFRRRRRTTRQPRSPRRLRPLAVRCAGRHGASGARGRTGRGTGDRAAAAAAAQPPPHRRRRTPPPPRDRRSSRRRPVATGRRSRRTVRGPARRSRRTRRRRRPGRRSRRSRRGRSRSWAGSRSSRCSW